MSTGLKLVASSTWSPELWILAVETPPRGCCSCCRCLAHGQQVEGVWLTPRLCSVSGMVGLALTLGGAFPNQTWQGGHLTPPPEGHTHTKTPLGRSSFSKKVSNSTLFTWTEINWTAHRVNLKVYSKSIWKLHLKAEKYKGEIRGEIVLVVAQKRNYFLGYVWAGLSLGQFQ